jgi:hypothetical protein
MTKEYIIKENTGTAFECKSDNPKAPAYSGKCDVDGIKKQIELWVNERENGEKYLSFKFKKPWVKPTAEEESGTKLKALSYSEVMDYPAKPEEPVNQIEEDGDIPF